MIVTLTLQWKGKKLQISKRKRKTILSGAKDLSTHKGSIKVIYC